MATKLTCYLLDDRTAYADEDGNWVKVEDVEGLEDELSHYQDGYKGSCYACEVVGERNVSLEAEIAQLRAELIDSEKQRAWLQNELVKMSSSEGNLRVQLHEVSEIYTGSDGLIPATAPEAYCLRIMYQMYRAALTEG